MKNIIVIIFSILLLVGCVKKVEETPEFSGTFSTEDVRTMWYFCHIASNRSVPMAPPPFHFAVCDCAIDQTRRDKTKKEVQNTDNATALQQYYSNVTQQCVKKIVNGNSSQEIKPTDTL